MRTSDYCKKGQRTSDSNTHGSQMITPTRGIVWHSITVSYGLFQSLKWITNRDDVLRSMLPPFTTIKKNANRHTDALEIT